jgi:hypothetical protein
MKIGQWLLDDVPVHEINPPPAKGTNEHQMTVMRLNPPNAMKMASKTALRLVGTSLAMT